jgi:hypothetical protein
MLNDPSRFSKGAHHDPQWFPTRLHSKLPCQQALRSTFRIDFSLRTAGLLRKTDDEQRSSPFRRPTTDDAPGFLTTRDEHSPLASRLHSHFVVSPDSAEA